MGVSRATKLHWFDLGARAFEAQFPGLLEKEFGPHAPLYICPICAWCFPRAAVDRGDLTEEHVPPKSLNGRGLILTCRKCNNDAGAFVDSHARRQANIEDTMSGAIEITRPVRVQLDGQTVNAVVSAGSEGWRLTLSDKHNRPGAIKAFNEAIGRRGGQQQQIGLDFHRDGFDHWAARISLLRSAFLVLVAFGGYGAAFNSALVAVRRQIREPHTRIIRRFVITTPERVPRSVQRWLDVREPDFHRCTAVQFGRRVVVLPNPNDVTFYDRLDTLDENVTINGQSFTWEPGQPSFGLRDV